MKIKFLGATQTVTGSRYLVEFGTSRVLIDCGLFQGYKNFREKNWAPFPVDPSTLDAVILTHAHIDHSGYIPCLVKNGFKGDVFATQATCDLSAIMLPDAGYLQEEEAAYANRKRFSKHKPALPLYTEDDAVKSLERFRAVDVRKPFRLESGLEITFTPAGHILGASSVRLQYQNDSILFSGDLGRVNDAVMRAPEAPESADIVVVESTYGNKRHALVEPLDELRDVINRTVERGSIVLIPSFAVGRAQLLLYYIHQLKERGEIADVPVYLNSPMASKVNDVFMKHARETRLSLVEARAVCGTARVVKTQEESIHINELTSPMIVVAASGMATGGRILHHLKAFAGDPRNSVVFAGFQVGGTRGDLMVRGSEEIKIHGQMWPVRAEVVNLESLSAHADSDEIMQWLKRLKMPKQVFVTHGELPASDALRLRIESTLGWRARVPDLLETVEF
ncbi:MAG: MBL fold metallo-hydrolase [Bdellovibrionales bacterium]|nr:MBL fold metallo-hydrolase [Bdellovibrionales bacterium]